MTHAAGETFRTAAFGWAVGAVARSFRTNLRTAQDAAAIISAMGDEDLILLDQWCAGDNAAGNSLLKRHFSSVARFFSNKADGEIDDLVQDTFLACVQQRDRFRRQSTFRTYLFAIARHVLYEHWGKASRRAAAIDFEEVSLASLSTSVGSRLARQGERARLLEALRQLPAEQQLLLELHYWEELERDQLAEVFEIEPATTRSRLFRARALLRERLSAASATLQPRAIGDDAFDVWARSLCPAVEEVRNAACRPPTTGA
jgi:RNA polymerase sigma factor (sigma-70 family)